MLSIEENPNTLLVDVNCDLPKVGVLHAIAMHLDIDLSDTGCWGGGVRVESRATVFISHHDMLL